MRFERGDVVLLAFPFSSETGIKQRPALVLLDPSDQDLLVARVTTQRYQSTFDVEMSEWKQAGLLAPSWVRLHKLAAVEQRLVPETGPLGRNRLVNGAHPHPANVRARWREIRMTDDVKQRVDALWKQVGLK